MKNRFFAGMPKHLNALTIVWKRGFNTFNLRYNKHTLLLKYFELCGFWVFKILCLCMLSYLSNMVLRGSFENLTDSEWGLAVCRNFEQFTSNWENNNPVWSNIKLGTKFVCSTNLMSTLLNKWEGVPVDVFFDCKAQGGGGGLFALFYPS